MVTRHWVDSFYLRHKLISALNGSILQQVVDSCRVSGQKVTRMRVDIEETKGTAPWPFHMASSVECVDRLLKNSSAAVWIVAKLFEDFLATPHVSIGEQPKDGLFRQLL